MNKLLILQTLGFTLEILTFVFAGVLIGREHYIRGGFVLILAVAIALGVGVLISKSAIQKYKEINK